MPISRLTPDIISAAIEGYEAQKSRIDARIAELRALLPGGRTDRSTPPQAPTQRRRKLSSAARARIAEAQRRRWAAAKKESATPVPAEAPKPKRKLSAAGKRNIIAAAKKRWAAVRTAKAAQAKTAPQERLSKRRRREHPPRWQGRRQHRLRPKSPDSELLATLTAAGTQVGQSTRRPKIPGHFSFSATFNGSNGRRAHI
jgi:hypothetical protein